MKCHGINLNMVFFTLAYTMKQQMANITQEQEGVERFNNWIEQLEEGKQPEACNIDDPNCENCGS